ncbi:hypothetical protein [Desulfosporosinus orientis]|uniref:hypothetical protein n=1 Tax=Desulfosporosinus orientis TaxID=1563 RepID=UPI001FA7B204|nr:hypothetical protein [Desulfosporosinus orientis]
MPRSMGFRRLIMLLVTIPLQEKLFVEFAVGLMAERFDVDLYIKLTEKITVNDGKLVVGLLDGSEVECEIE